MTQRQPPRPGQERGMVSGLAFNGLIELDHGSPQAIAMRAKEAAWYSVCVSTDLGRPASAFPESVSYDNSMIVNAKEV